MILNAEQLADLHASGWMLSPREQDMLDTIADLQRQLADLEILHGTKKAFDAYVQQRVDEAVLAEFKEASENWYAMTPGEFNGWIDYRLAVARSRVQGKPVTPKVEGD